MKVNEVDCDFVSSSRMDHGGPQTLKPGLRKCECVFSLIHENFERNWMKNVKEVKNIQMMENLFQPKLTFILNQ